MGSTKTPTQVVGQGGWGQVPTLYNQPNMIGTALQQAPQMQQPTQSNIQQPIYGIPNQRQHRFFTIQPQQNLNQLLLPREMQNTPQLGTARPMWGGNYNQELNNNNIGGYNIWEILQQLLSQYFQQY